MSGPRSILANRDEVAAWLDGGDGILLGLDFDGTLAPIMSDPDDARLDGRAKPIVDGLANHPNVTVAIISGRSLDDLQPRVSIDGPLYAGNHGLELSDGTTRRTHPAAEARRGAIERITQELRTRSADDPGVLVEYKGLTATVHFRQSSDPDAVASTVENVVAARDADVEVTSGRAIREIRPALQWGKDAAMLLFQSLAPPDFRAMYVGDDVTDEAAFDAIDDPGVAVRVGTETGPDTDASHQVQTQEAVPELLAWLADYADDRWNGTGAVTDTAQPLDSWDEHWYPAQLKH